MYEATDYCDNCLLYSTCPYDRLVVYPCPYHIPQEGQYIAPDGWTAAWHTVCVKCERDVCRNDCGHPGDFAVINAAGVKQHNVSGPLVEVDIKRLLREFKQEHQPQQLSLFAQP